MVILAIILGLISLGCGIKWLINYKSSGLEGGFGWAFGFWVIGIIWFFVFLGTFRFNLGTNNLTGYIYSYDTRFGYITGHIRFSEQAGQDVQPSFCTKASSEPGKQIKKLTGSGKKVSITKPPYFYFTNNPFACGTTQMKIEEIKGENNG